MPIRKPDESDAHSGVPEDGGLRTLDRDRPGFDQLAGLQRCGRRLPRDSPPDRVILDGKKAGADTQIRTADLLFTK
jgi:hypothetical protein